MKRAAAALAFCALFAGLAWALAWSSVDVLLARDAAARAAAWTAGGTPWQWSLGEDGAVVWAGSTGFVAQRESAHAVVGMAPDGNADFSIDLRGEAIDLALVSRARVTVFHTVPVAVSLLAEVDGRTVTLGESGLVAQRGTVEVPFDARHRAGHARALRLHVETAPRATFAITRVQLLPARPLRPQPCASLACDAAVPRVGAPDFVASEPLLAWRDAALRERPAAIVTRAQWAGGAAVPGQRLAQEALDASAHVFTPAAFLLLPILAALLSRLRRTPPRAGQAALELAILFSPWLLMQWAGVPAAEPGDGVPPRAAWFAIGGVAGALIAVPFSGWRWFGDRAAWKALRPFVAAAVAVLIAVALPGGFETRDLPWSKAWQYPPWAVLQQLILMHAIAPRTRALARGDALFGALLAGAVFALLHLPNFALMLATFAAGSAWAWHGYRHRALLPLAAVHVAAGVALLWLAPPWLLRSAEIGGRYLMAP